MSISEYTKDFSAARNFLAKLARCGYFKLFKFHHFKHYPIQFLHSNSLQQKKTFISASICLSIESCCSSSCVQFHYKSETKNSRLKTFRIKIYRGLYFWFFWWQHRRITFLLRFKRDMVFNIKFQLLFNNIFEVKRKSGKSISWTNSCCDLQ